MKQNPLWQGTQYDRFVVEPDEEDELWASEPLNKVLIVDDEERIRSSLFELLRREGYECWAVGSGEQAAELLNDCRFDLMLLDLNMPGMDGHAVLELVNRIDHQPAVVVLSGETSFEHATRALRGGAKDFLRKPYEPADLLRTVKSLLEKQRLLTENRRMQDRLSASEQLHRFIVNNSPDIIYMLDDKGRFTFVNERVGSLLGRPHEELLGKLYTEIVYREDVEKARWAINERRTAERATHNLELRLKRRPHPAQTPASDSHSLPVELNSMGVYRWGRDQAGHFVGTYGVARDISERKQAEELIEFQLYHDLLTRLPNRALFRDRLGLAITQAKRSGAGLAVMFIDLDRFKSINDSLGHLVADQLLRAVSDRLKGCLREGDTLARVGGDEFTLLLPSIRQREDAATIADKVNNAFVQPFSLEGLELYVTGSVGIALYPEDGESEDSLIGNADIAMYEVKRQGKNGYLFYDAVMRPASGRQTDTRLSLRRAIMDNELSVYYQPIVNLQGREILGVEALVRWVHPEQGLLMPADFLSLAKEEGLLMELSGGVLRKACRDYMHWWEQVIAPPRLAVNLHPSLLGREDFEDWLSTILNECEMPYGALEVEVTQNALMPDAMSVAARLARLRQAHGVKLSIDDFGTGYSSLGYLQVLPVNNLKLDRSFLEKIRGSTKEDAIIEAIASLARSLKLDLIAEGVESQKQLDYLVKLNCAVGQGFFFSKPLPFDAMTGLLRNWPHRDRISH